MVPSASLPPQAGGKRLPRRGSDPAEAERMVAEVFLPHRLDLPPGVKTVELDLLDARFGALKVARLAYGRDVVLHTDSTVDVFVSCILSGRATASSGTALPQPVAVGSVLVFPTGAPVHLSLSADGAVLGLMISRAALETELEALLGQSLPGPLQFTFDLDPPERVRTMWAPVLRLLTDELRHPTRLTEHPVSARHVKGVVLDVLLLGHGHNHRELLDRAAPPLLSGVVERAVQLMAERPEKPWSTVRLAGEVHISVRALQSAFRRDLGLPPMDYLRDVRLRQVRKTLVEARRDSTTVRAVAAQAGFVHLGRFAATYRDRYGESPVETLRRPPP